MLKDAKTDKQPDESLNVQQAFADLCRKIDDKTPRVGKRSFSGQDEILQSSKLGFPIRPW